MKMKQALISSLRSSLTSTTRGYFCFFLIQRVYGHPFRCSRALVAPPLGCVPSSGGRSVGVGDISESPPWDACVPHRLRHSSHLWFYSSFSSISLSSTQNWFVSSTNTLCFWCLHLIKFPFCQLLARVLTYTGLKEPSWGEKRWHGDLEGKLDVSVCGGGGRGGRGLEDGVRQKEQIVWIPQGKREPGKFEERKQHRCGWTSVLRGESAPEATGAQPVAGRPYTPARSVGFSLRAGTQH